MGDQSDVEMEKRDEHENENNPNSNAVNEENEHLPESTSAEIEGTSEAGEGTNRGLELGPDPALWSDKITDADRVILVTNGPVNPDANLKYEYPVNKSNRRFSPNCVKRLLKNGEEVVRSWLVYSQSKDGVYCFCCKLFSKPQISFTTTGYNDWKHLHEALKSHETSSNHLRACTEWMELARRLDCARTIDSEHQKTIQAETQRWKAVLERLLSIITFLGEQCLAFRGSSDVLFEKNNGNFLKLVELLAKFDNVMAEHVRRAANKEIHTHYLSKIIQNELIDLIADRVRNEIILKVKSAKYYSIIVDCTRDVSKIEQMSIVLRCVAINDTAGAEIHEYFWGFLPTNKTTGEALCKEIVDELNRFGIPLGDMRGQGYDNGSNMKGHESGVQRRILQLNNRAFFVPCYAHSLNLVVNDAARSSKDGVMYFAIVQRIYNFLSGSTRRWAVLKDHLKAHLTVKPLSNTRWESRIEAVRPFRYSPGEIYDSLYEISQDSSYDVESRCEAESLAKKMKTFSFCCCTVIWHKILNQVNLVSKGLQNIETDISEAVEKIEKTLNFLKLLRSDSGFDEVVADATILADDLDAELSFPPATSIRARRKRAMQNESRDEPIQDPKNRFKVECFFLILDQAITSVEERFNQLQNHADRFKFLYNIGDLKRLEKADLLKKCEELASVLSQNEDSDIDPVELCDELVPLLELIEPNTAPIEVLRFLVRNKLTTPNVVVALRILLTLPVTVASGERSFSKMKLIKNYLRSTMAQNRLSGLALISIESAIAKNLDFNDILQKFAEKKARKVILK